MYLRKAVYIGEENKDKDAKDILCSMHDGKINLDRYIEKFTFNNNVYYHKKELFQKLLDENFVEDCLKGDVEANIKDGFKGLIADLAASVVQRLFESGFIHENLDTESIKVCRDILVNKGYKELTTDILENEITLNSKRLSGEDYGEVQNVMLVAGCQDEHMLNRRLYTALYMIPRFRTNLTVVMSGGNPIANGAPSTNILDESIRMYNRLQELIDVNPEVRLPYSFSIERDGNSSNTRNNIKETLHHFVSSKEKVYNIHIVSSTFHLIRLAKELEAELSLIFNSEKNLPDEERTKIENIVLIGAEKVETKFKPVHDGPYMKLMFVDIFRYLSEYRKEKK